MKIGKKISFASLNKLNILENSNDFKTRCEQLSMYDVGTCKNYDAALEQNSVEAKQRTVFFIMFKNSYKT